MDEESQRRVILSCSQTLTSEISTSQSFESAGEEAGVCGKGLSSRWTEALWGWAGVRRDSGGVGSGDLGLWWLLSKQHS